ncbi:hypothetical protein EC988_001521 [Linderina pennispora]|nr:hypothetical protein EC988_001521 [Linderina pennispora]
MDSFKQTAGTWPQTSSRHGSQTHSPPRSLHSAGNSVSGFHSGNDDLVPLRQLRASQDALQPEPTDMITGWLYNGPLQRARYEDFSTIDWIYETAKARRNRSSVVGQARGWRGRLKVVWNASQSWMVLLAVGVFVGVLATCIAVSAQWLTDIKNGHCRTGFHLNRRFCCWQTNACADWETWSETLHVRWHWVDWLLQYLVYVTLAIVFAAASTYLVTECAPYAAGQGIAEIKTIMGGFMMRRFLGARTLMVKCVGVVLAVAAGLSLGKEGPMVHIACCLGNVCARLFAKLRNNEARRRELLAAAAAAGIAAAFGAPIGGVLFSLEQVSYYFPAKTMWRSLFCATVAAVTLKALDPFRTGKLVPFQVTYDRTWDQFELPVFALIGAVCGLLGVVQNRLASHLMQVRRRSRLAAFARGEVVVVALATALLSYPSAFLRADTVALVSNLFTECATADSQGLCNRADRSGNALALVVTALVRVVLTAVASGLAVPAGMLMPSMGAGASVGRAMGMAVQAMQENHPQWRVFAACNPDVPCVTPGVYALVGAAAMLAATTRMTVTVVVIMFELTGALIYVLPIMLSVTVARWTADAFGKAGFFEAIIRLNGYPFLGMEQEGVLHGNASEAMVRASEMQVLEAGSETLEGIQEMLACQMFSGFPVVRSRRSMALVGYIARSDLAMVVERAQRSGNFLPTSLCCFARMPDGEPAVDMRPWVDQAPMTIHYSMDINDVAEIFRQLGVRYVLVAHHSVLLGIITKKDILRAIRMQARGNFGKPTLMSVLACGSARQWTPLRTADRAPVFSSESAVIN